MDHQGTASPAKHEAAPRQRNARPRCLVTSEKGIKTGAQFADFMSQLMSDIVARRVTPDIGNAACNAGGKLLKVVEMQFKYGQPEAGTSVLTLAAGAGEASR